jgi:hypothetical protein
MLVPNLYYEDIFLVARQRVDGVEEMEIMHNKNPSFLIVNFHGKQQHIK